MTATSAPNEPESVFGVTALPTLARLPDRPEPTDAYRAKPLLLTVCPHCFVECETIGTLSRHLKYRCRSLYGRFGNE